MEKIKRVVEKFEDKEEIVKLINCSQEACCSLQYLALASKLVKYNFVNLHMLYDLCGDNFFVVLA